MASLHECRSILYLVVGEKIFDDRSNHARRLESNGPRWVSHINVIVLAGLRCCWRHVGPMKKAKCRASGDEYPFQRQLKVAY